VSPLATGQRRGAAKQPGDSSRTVLRTGGGAQLVSEEHVREVVRRVVGAMYDAGTQTASPGASTGTGDATAESPAKVAARVAIAIGADHGGFELKELIGRRLTDAGYTVHDCGTSSPDPVDYPDFAHAVARLVADGTCRWGIAVDGAGIGSCMVANKVPGVRAAACHDVASARNSREHNHANVLTLGARFIDASLAMEIVDAWLTTPWGPDRHAARVAKIGDVERRYLKAGA
jgi:ribose 5-phosphate isomerase B